MLNLWVWEASKLYVDDNQTIYAALQTVCLTKAKYGNLKPTQLFGPRYLQRAYAQSLGMGGF